MTGRPIFLSSFFSRKNPSTCNTAMLNCGRKIAFSESFTNSLASQRAHTHVNIYPDRDRRGFGNEHSRTEGSQERKQRGRPVEPPSQTFQQRKLRHSDLRSEFGFTSLRAQVGYVGILPLNNRFAESLYNVPRQI